jgi:D-alanyl-D-alanine carboxypeptidase
MKRKIWFRNTVFWIAATTLFSTLPASAQSLNPGQSKLDTYLKTLNDSNKIMTAVYVSEYGSPRYEYYSGFASVEDNVPISEKTRFRIGSISKTFTAVLVMQLVEAEKLSLDTKLDTFYPDVPNAKDITIKQLLSHRSGIFNFTDDLGYMNYMTTPQTQAQMLARIQAYKPLFEPDSRHQYSNSNYVLLGFILEDIYEKSLVDIIAEQITQPLKLDDTYYGNSIEIEENEASSYRFSGSWEKQPETHMSVPHGAGSIVSTAKDTNQFFADLFAGKLISPASLTAMMQMEDGYGLGMIVAPFGDQKFHGHFGNIDGFASAAGYNTKDGLTITVLSNAVNYSFNDVLIAVLRRMYDQDIEIPDFTAKPIELGEDVLAAFEGKFSSAQIPIGIRFWVEDGKLMSQGDGQNAFPLVAYSDTEFRFEQAGIRIRFEQPSSKTGKSSSFTLYQGGGAFLFNRK